MTRFLIVLSLAAAFGAWAQNQACLVSAPPAPPTPRELRVQLPEDGGTVGCTVEAYVPNGRPPTKQPVGNSKCAQAVAMAQQAAANDNGWNDGGTP